MSLTTERDATSPRVASLTSAVPIAIYVLVFLAVVLAIEPWPVGVFQDDGVYAVLAKSLATGHGYRYLNIPGEPLATHYPPGYPLLLALLWKVGPAFPQNVTLFKFANAFLLATAALGFLHLARTRLKLGIWPAALGVLAFTACAPVILLTVMVLSEPLFLALMVPVLIMAERASESGRVRDAVIVALLASVLAMVRTIGLMIVPATLLVMCWRRSWRQALTLGVVTALLMLPWQLWVRAHAGDVSPIYIGKYGSYTAWFTDAVQRHGVGFVRDVAWTNLKNLVAQGWATTATDTLPAPVRNATSVALSFFFGLGLAALGRRAPAIALFVILYLCIVVVWPFAPARFTWGIWPLLGLVFVLAAVTASTWSARAGKLTAYAVLSLLAVGYGGYNWLGASRGWWTQQQMGIANRARPLAEWVQVHTDTNAVLASDDDVLIYLYTGRRTVPNVVFTPEEHMVRQTPAFATASLRRIMATYHPDYVLASSDYGTYAASGLLQASPPELRLVNVLKLGVVLAPVPVPNQTQGGGR